MASKCRTARSGEVKLHMPRTFRLRTDTHNNHGIHATTNRNRIYVACRPLIVPPKRSFANMQSTPMMISEANCMRQTAISRVVTRVDRSTRLIHPARQRASRPTTGGISLSDDRGNGQTDHASTLGDRQVRMGLQYYAENSTEFLAPRPVATQATESWIRFDPLVGSKKVADLIARLEIRAVSLTIGTTGLT